MSARESGWLSKGPNFPLALLGASVAALALGVLHVGTGTVQISPPEVLAALVNDPVEAFHRQIVWELRLPRTLIALLAGAMLGLAGAMLQSLTRNALAEPGIVGVSAGGVFFAALWLSAGSSSETGRVLPAVVLAGGLVASGLVYLLGRSGGTDPQRLVLAGVLLGSIFTSATSILLVRDQETLGNILLWIIGSLNGRGWSHWAVIWPWAAVALPLGLACAALANVLQLGDEVAGGLGLRVEWARATLLGGAAVLTAGAVAVVGAVGFVGLIGPHIARRLVGDDARRVFALSAALGAVLLVAADVVAQGGLSPALSWLQLPVGAVTAALGAPFFLYLIRRSPR